MLFFEWKILSFSKFSQEGQRLYCWIDEEVFFRYSRRSMNIFWEQRKIWWVSNTIKLRYHLFLSIQKAIIISLKLFIFTIPIPHYPPKIVYLYERDIKMCVTQHFEKFDVKIQKDKENKMNFYKAMEEYIVKNKKSGVRSLWRIWAGVVCPSYIHSSKLSRIYIIIIARPLFLRICSNLNFPNVI